MAAPIKPNGGRKSLIEEKIRSAVINKSWDKCSVWLDEEKTGKTQVLTQEQEFDLVKTIVGKSVPKNLDITSGGDKLVISWQDGNSNTVQPKGVGEEAA